MNQRYGEGKQLAQGHRATNDRAEFAPRQSGCRACDLTSMHYWLSKKKWQWWTKKQEMEKSDKRKGAKEWCKRGLLGTDHNESCVLMWTLWQVRRGCLYRSHNLFKFFFQADALTSYVCTHYPFLLTPVGCTGSNEPVIILLEFGTGTKRFQLWDWIVVTGRRKQELWEAKSCLPCGLKSLRKRKYRSRESRLLFSVPAAPFTSALWIYEVPVSPFPAYIRARWLVVLITQSLKDFVHQEKIFNFIWRWWNNW